jgi:hypothetical protein
VDAAEEIEGAGFFECSSEPLAEGDGVGSFDSLVRKRDGVL